MLGVRGGVRSPEQPLDTVSPLDERLDESAPNEAIRAGYRDPHRPAFPLVDMAHAPAGRVSAGEQNERALPTPPLQTSSIFNK